MSDNSPPPVGIDLGTSFSVVAHLTPDGKPQTISNAEGDLITPSVVLFDEQGVVVGKEAVKAAEMEPARVAMYAKRDMGEESYSREVAGHKLPPEVIQACVLRKLRQDAALVLGELDKVVITVPAYFNEPRRKATQDAGRLAGLDVVDIINEPTAAAIAFGVQKGFLTRDGASHEPEKLLVYDLGGGTFDVTLMSIEGSSYDTLATAGDVFLGGADFDQRIVDYLAELFLEQHGVDPREDPGAQQRLLHEAEDAKRALTARPGVNILFKHEGDALKTQLTRERFEELTADLLDRTRFTAAKLLKDAGVKWTDLTRVLLVGGSTRMPMVGQMLEKESGVKPDRSIAADEAVAHGAAIFAGMLLAQEAGQRPNVSVTNVNSHNLGVLAIEPKTGRKRTKVLIPKNTSLPATEKRPFVTHQDGQKSVAVNVVEGGDASGANSTKIGKCVIKDLPKGLPKGTAVEVAFHYAENGRLTVDATVPSAEASATLVIERAAGLSEDEIVAWRDRIEAGLELEDAPTIEPSDDDELDLHEPEAAEFEDVEAADEEEEETAAFVPPPEEKPVKKPAKKPDKKKPADKKTSKASPAIDTGKAAPSAVDDDAFGFLEDDSPEKDDADATAFDFGEKTKKDGSVDTAALKFDADDDEDGGSLDDDALGDFLKGL